MLVHGNSQFFTRWYTAVQMTGFYFCNTPIPEKNGSCMEMRLNSPHSKFEITNYITWWKIKSISLQRTFLALALVKKG